MRADDGTFGWETPARSIGRMHSWHGNALALARAYSYLLANGGDGLRRVAEGAVLNANWLRHRLRGSYDIPYDRPNMHEFVASTAGIKKRGGVRALDVAKRHAGGGLPRADGVLPADRRRGADDRADRDREPADPRGAGRGVRAHRHG